MAARARVERAGAAAALASGAVPAPADDGDAPAPDDAEIVVRQLGRRPRAFRRVAYRCPFGLPAVTEQAPYDDDGDPFPTTYYLTCPHLVAAVSRLEAAGGVERWSKAAELDAELRASAERAAAEQRAVREELAGGVQGPDGGASLALGIGGASRPTKLKCLHAHVAFALARGRYELGERSVSELEPLWPAAGCSSPPETDARREGLAEGGAPSLR